MDDDVSLPSDEERALDDPPGAGFSARTPAVQLE
jgi:hypothetical protein